MSIFQSKTSFVYLLCGKIYPNREYAHMLDRSNGQKIQSHSHKHVLINDCILSTQVENLIANQETATNLIFSTSYAYPHGISLSR